MDQDFFGVFEFGVVHLWLGFLRLLMSDFAFWIWWPGSLDGLLCGLCRLFALVLWF